MHHLKVAALRKAILNASGSSQIAGRLPSGENGTMESRVNTEILMILFTDLMIDIEEIGGENCRK